MSETQFRPTMLVGVGGTGCDIAEKVYADAINSRAAANGKIAVLGFDTDDNDMKRLKSIEPRNRIRFSTPDTLGTIALKYQSEISSWFVDPVDSLPEYVKQMTLMDGAAQIRMFTHLGLFTNLVSDHTPQTIGDALASLASFDNKDTYDGIINVMIVGSLAGATGSGSFIQIALMIQKAANTRGLKADVRGLFLLPDVYVNGASLPSDQIPNVLANGYAALKELNGVNVVAAGHNKNLEFKYEYAPRRAPSLGDFPYQSVTLIDFETTSGGSLGKNLESYKKVARRAVYQQIFSPIGGKVRSVEVNDARAKIAAAASESDNKFSSVGVGAIVYPRKDISEFLKFKFSTQILSGDWARLDQQFQQRIKRYHEQREQGNLIDKKPEQDLCYLEDLDNLALTEKNAFFAEIHSNLYPEVEREQGKQVLPVFETYLNDITDQVIQGFWAADSLKQASSRKNIDSSQLKNVSTLSSTVRDLENCLDDDLINVDSLVRSRATDVFLNILSNADDAVENSWKSHHIQSYLIKGGPHLVQIRYFIYALRKLIRERNENIDPGGTLLRLYKQANQFDSERGLNPKERSSYKIIDEATKAARQGFLSKIMGGGAKVFAEKYVTYFNNSRRILKQYAEESVHKQLYKDLESELLQLERVLSGLVVEVGGIVDSLQAKTEQELRKHDSNSGQDGSLYVYASSESKQSIWASFEEKSSGISQDQRANAELSAAVYAKYRSDRKLRKSSSFSGLRELINETVINGFATRVVEDELNSVYDFNVIQAIRHESDSNDINWKDRLRDVIRIIGRQSEPLISLNDQYNDGQRITYWAINPSAFDEIGDVKEASELFTFNQGESPLILEEFSDAELLCMNSRVNLELNFLSKLNSGLQVRFGNQKGKYYEEYEKLVSAILASNTSGAASESFTPHIHRDWHKPGFLPEIDPSVSEYYLNELYESFVFSLACEAIQTYSNYGSYVSEFNSVGLVTESEGIRSKLVETNQLNEVLDVFEFRGDLIVYVKELWSELSVKRIDIKGDSNIEFREIKLVSQLTAPDLVMKFLEFGINRRDADKNDPRVKRLITAWAKLVSKLVNTHETQLALPGRKQLASEIIDEVEQLVMSRLKTTAKQETFIELKNLFAQGISKFRKDSVD